MQDSTNNLPSVSEVEQVRSIFGRMADSIVEASRLKETVEALRREVDGFVRELDQLRERNRELDEMVQHVRRERDEAKAEAERLRQEVKALREGNNSYDRELEQLRADFSSIHAQLVDARRDRDEASFKNLELTEELEKLREFKRKVQELSCPKPEDTTSSDYQNRYNS